MISNARANGSAPNELTAHEMSFELIVLEDVASHADLYWKNWLWRREQPEYAPSEEFLLSMQIHGDRPTIESAWRRWFGVLTSWEYVDALIGRDVRRLMEGYESAL